MENNDKIYIGFITYGDTTAKYLPYFVSSLKNQTISNIKILAFDNTENSDNANIKYLKENHPDIEIMTVGNNIGFGQAYNKMFDRAIEVEARYFLAINPDAYLANDAIEKMILTIEKDDQIAAVCPMIMKWDFSLKQATDIIDSLGLTMTKDFCFFDRYQGINMNSVPKEELIEKEVFGFTGAAVMFSLDKLQTIAFENGNNREYFDELMFMYKEDCDLSLRLRLAGYKIVFTPQAIAYHDRTASSKGKSIWQTIKNRQNKSKSVKVWSFINQRIILKKYAKLDFSTKIKLAIGWYQFKSFVYLLFFEQFLLKEYFKLYRLRKEIEKRSNQLRINISINEIEKFIE